jgi:hypothetical protein
MFGFDSHVVHNVTLEELMAGAAGRIRKWLKATIPLHGIV